MEVTQPLFQQNGGEIVVYFYYGRFCSKQKELEVSAEIRMIFTILNARSSVLKECVLLQDQDSDLIG